MKSIENKQLLKNLLLNNNTKLVTRQNLSKNLFIVDNNNELNILFKKKEDTREGKSEYLSLQNLKHKRLKYMSINAYIANNITPKNSNKVTAFYNLFKQKKTCLKIIKSIRGGYLVLSSEGIVGFIYRRDFLKAIKMMHYVEKTKHKDLHKICGLLNPNKNYSLFNFEAKIKKLKFFLPRIKVSRKYFIPKHSGRISITFTPCIDIKNKPILKEINKNRKKKKKTNRYEKKRN